MNRSDRPLELVPAKLNTRQRFVRVTGQRGQDFVEFDFAIGEPDLFVEMILSPAAFAEFSATNQVVILPPADGVEGEASDWDWRLSDATRLRFRK